MIASRSSGVALTMVLIDSGFWIMDCIVEMLPYYREPVPVARMAGWRMHGASGTGLINPSKPYSYSKGFLRRSRDSGVLAGRFPAPWTILRAINPAPETFPLGHSFEAPRQNQRIRNSKVQSYSVHHSGIQE